VKELILKREYRPYITLGSLLLPNGDSLKTLERAWINNEPNISCIPEGEYLCKWMEASASGKYKRVWHLQDVEGRSAILIHAGNLVRHTKGCILVGKHHGRIKGHDAVLSSKPALNKLRRVFEGSDFKLKIG
jgi:hypothetical protein